MLVLRGLELKIDRLLDLFMSSEQLKENNQNSSEIHSEWITLKQACELHGGYKLSTLRARLDLQPKCGRAVKIGTNKCWHKDEIDEWLNLKTKEERENYKRKYMEVM